VINWKYAPAYKVAKMIAKKLQAYIPLPYMFNVKNTTHFVEELKEIPFSHNLRLASFDIRNMHINIPTGELVRIIEKACRNNCIESNLKLDIIKLIKTILYQNYFQFHGKTYVQSEGLAMETPTSFYTKFIYST
jgi:hypothetical protein